MQNTFPIPSLDRSSVVCKNIFIIFVALLEMDEISTRLFSIVINWNNQTYYFIICARIWFSPRDSHFQQNLRYDSGYLLSLFYSRGIWQREEKNKIFNKKWLMRLRVTYIQTYVMLHGASRIKTISYHLYYLICGNNRTNQTRIISIYERNKVSYK